MDVKGHYEENWGRFNFIGYIFVTTLILLGILFHWPHVVMTVLLFAQLRCAQTAYKYGEGKHENDET